MPRLFGNAPGGDTVEIACPNCKITLRFFPADDGTYPMRHCPGCNHDCSTAITAELPTTEGN